MLTYSTRSKLAAFLLAVNEGERQIEIIRQILCEQEDFEPYAAFKRIDRLKRGALNAFDIMNFLADNKIQQTERDCHIFIQRYDADGDGQLIYSEFLQSVLTVDNTILRTVTTQRPNYNVGQNEFLPYDVEYALSKVIDKEINFFIDLDDQRKELLNFHDFNYPSAFGTIDKYTCGSVNYDNLKAFFSGQGIYPGDEEIIAVLRRLDKNDDGLVTYTDLVEILEPVNDGLRATANRRNASSKFETPTRTGSLRANSSARKEASPVRTASPLRMSASPMKVDTAPKREASPFRRTASPFRKAASPSISNEVPEREAPSSAIKDISPILKQTFPSRTSESPYKREASPHRRIATAEKSLGESSVSRGVSPLRKAASPAEFSETASSSLRKSQIYKDFPKSQAKSPAKTRNEEPSSASRKNYSEVQTPEKRSTSQSRQLSTSKSVKKNLSFDEGVSHYVLIQTLKQFIVLDKDLEIAKQDLALKSDFNLLDFFRTFDLTGRGSISSKEFENGLIRYGIYPNKDELALFFKKLDFDNDGLLRFSDYAETFTPKQREYANLLHNRTPTNIETLVDIHKIFSLDTKTKIINVLKLHLENEGSSESLRQRLKSKGDMSGHEAFKYLDLKGDGFVTSEELFGVFQENDSFLTEREVKLLMDRLDQDKDGKVSYYELLAEITPKSEQCF